MIKAIIANGSAISRQRLEDILSEVEEIIAADGGANLCRELGIEPDIIIGDLDSWQEQKSASAQVLYLPDQEQTDLQKAINYADLASCSKLKIISAFGKRSDHSMVNMIIFAQSSYPEKLEIYDNFSKTILFSAGEHQLQLEPGTLVSFYAFGQLENLSLQGVKYELKEKSYQQGFCGISNEVSSKKIDLSFDKGLLFCAIAE